MAKIEFFTKAGNKKTNSDIEFRKGVDAIRAFVMAACETPYIDDYTERDVERQSERVTEFCLKAAESENRYKYSSIRNGNDYGKWLIKKGEIEPRSKLFDYYLRLKKNKDTGMLTLEFTVQGHSKMAKTWGSNQQLQIITFDRRRVNPFFSHISDTIVEIDPAIRASSQRITRRLDRLTSQHSLG